MFNHIGRKVKVLAAIWGIVGIAGSIAAGVLLYEAQRQRRAL